MQPPSITLQQLLREEPFVRALARQLVAEEAEDVVQQTFLRGLERAPTAVDAPRGWLARVVRNLAQDVRRRRRRRLARESEVAREPAVPSSQQLLEAEELRRAVVAAVDALPEPQRTVVLLRYYEGLPPRRIATRLAIPAATVSHRLHEAIGMLRERLDRGHGGGRRAWGLPLLTLARLPQRLPLAEVLAHPVATPGLALFTMSTKPLLACLVALLLSLCWLLWPASSAPLRVAERPDAATPAAATLAGSPSETRAPLPRAVAVAPEASGELAGTGTLAVTVVHAEQPRAGADVVVMVRPVAGHARLDLTTAVTDAAGRVEFADLVPGRWALRTAGRPTREAVIEVRAGQRTEHTLALDGNLTVRGIVVSPLGVPVADASIEAALPAFTSADAHRVATSRADGTFELHDCEPIALLGARAPGFAASQLYFLQGDAGVAAELRIELRDAGGTVTGLVVDGTGAPVRGALVRVGEGRSNSVRSTPAGAAPLPAVVRTASDGWFTAFGVAAGTVPVQVVARGCAPWFGTGELAAGASVALRIELQAGAACAGIVRGVDDQAVAGARVDVGTRDDLWAQETFSAADGRFALRGLPAGEVEVRAATPRAGKAAARFVGVPGSTTAIELRLDRGRVLTVRVVDEQGEPVPFATAQTAAEGAGAPWSQYGHSDREGRFELTEWPVDRALTIEVRKRGHLTARHLHAAFGPASITVQLPRDARPSAQILGRILRPDGSPATGLDVDAVGDEPRQQTAAATAADGSFVLAVPEGSWRLRVAAAGYPEVRLGPTKLLAGQPWQVGTVQLTLGGTLHVELPTELADAGTVFTATAVFVSGLAAPVPPLRSALLAPGDYVVQLQPVGRAALSLPFVIRAGATTTLRPVLVVGVEQRIEFAAAGEPLGSVEFELRRDGARLLIGRASDGTPQRRTVGLWLAPGRYAVVTRGRQPAAEAEFAVGAAAGAAVVVMVR